MSFVCLSYIVPHSLIKALFHHIDSLRNNSGVTLESMFTIRVKFWKQIGHVKRKVPPSIRNMCGFTSSCTRAKSRPEKCSPLKHYIVSKDSVCWQRRPWSDIAVRICPKTRFDMARPRLQCWNMYPYVASALTLCMFGIKNSAADVLKTNFYFFQKRGFCILLKLSPKDFMKLQNQFSWKNNKTFVNLSTVYHRREWCRLIIWVMLNEKVRSE